MKNGLLIILSICFQTLVFGQDALFSNFTQGIQRINPAINQTFNYDGHFQVNYRNQNFRFSQPNAPSTIMASYDQAFGNRETDKFSFGLNLMNDRQGRGHLNTTSILLNFSYLKKIGGKYNDQSAQYIGIGAQAGVFQTRFVSDDLWFGNQYNEGGFIDFGAETGEVGFVEYENPWNGLSPDINLGVLYYNQINSNYHFNAGVSVSHIYGSEISFVASSSSPILRRYNIHMGAKIAANSNFYFAPKAFFIQQGQSNILLFGSNFNFDNPEFLEVALRLGVYSRFVNGINGLNSDALIITTGILYRNFEMGLNYDISVSGLSNYNGNRGGWELMLVYHWNKDDFRPGARRSDTYFSF